MTDKPTTATQTIDSALKGVIVEPAPLAVIPPASGADDMAALMDFGFVLPIATPELLRRAFAEKQALLAAILDPHDYIYVVPFTDPVTGKQRQHICGRKEDADKAFEMYKTEILAKPKKSGIVKLACALNIECRRVKSSGLPEEPGATYAWVLYQATHKRTGRTEEGIGWCDKSEKGGKITTHELIATADTRGYNRAVLRLAGFGDVSAEEVLGGGGSTGTIIETTGTAVADVTAARAAEARPANNQEVVIAAARTWADAVLARSGERFLPVAQQSSKPFRELRARARRGDIQSAKQLGVLGLHWEGVAQDAMEYDTFQVEAPPVSLDDVQRVRDAAAAQQQAAQAAGQNGGSGHAAPATEPATTAPAQTQAAPAAAPAAVASPAAAMKPAAAHPPPDPEDAITMVQAKQLSEALLKAVGTKDAAVSWLQQNAGVQTSRQVRGAQFEALMSKISQLSKEA